MSNEDKSIVPRRGYILIDPASPRGQELASKYPTNLSYPRWVVSWTFITACLHAKKVLDAGVFADVKPLFLDPDDNTVLSIYLTSTIQGIARNDLATKIAVGVSSSPSRVRHVYSLYAFLETWWHYC